MSTAVAWDLETQPDIPQTSGRTPKSWGRTRSMQIHSDECERSGGSGLSTESPRFSFEQESAFLHRGLVGMSQGLLQYASRSSLWVPTEEKQQCKQLHLLVAKQRESIRRLFELLHERRYPIEWGVFPVEYTRFNYVALKFLWSGIAEFQTQLVRMLEAIRNELENNSHATGVLDDILQTEREISAELGQATPARTMRPVASCSGPRIACDTNSESKMMFPNT